MIDKNYCMSSYLSLRYVEDDDKQFFDGFCHQVYKQQPLDRKVFVSDAHDLDIALRNVFRRVAHEKLGMLLSGGMDSSILASYMPEGADAYTFRFLGGKYQSDELERAEYYAKYYHLNLHYVDIDWSTVEQNVDKVMAHKGAPVHAIEPQLYAAAIQAKKDGITMLIIGDAADYVFGGMDGLLSQNWSYDQYVKRTIYVNPVDVLNEPYDMNYLFERYRIGKNSIDYLLRVVDVGGLGSGGQCYEAYQLCRRAVERLCSQFSRRQAGVRVGRYRGGGKQNSWEDNPAVPDVGMDERTNYGSLLVRRGGADAGWHRARADCLQPSWRTDAATDV